MICDPVPDPTILWDRSALPPTGDPVAGFLKIDNEMRKAKNKTLSDLRFRTAEKFLWSEPFLQTAVKAEATFAATRNCI